jgi:acyl-homoserine-lactone acylase
MNLLPTIGWRSSAIVLSIATLVACSDSSNNRASAPPIVEPPVEPALTYDAEIVWTEYGIPHITAQDWGSLGYGTAYAYAQENYCWAMKAIINASGESARYLGGSVFRDLVIKAQMSDERLRELYFDDVSERVAALRDGYAAGMNRYLRETGVDNLAEGADGCRGAAWVREVDAMDIARMLHTLTSRNGPLANTSLGEFIYTAQPPEFVAQVNTPASMKETLAAFDQARFIASIAVPEPDGIGSNSYAIGGEASQTGAGILWDNPHLYWRDRAYFMAHQTMADEFNLMGTLAAGHPLMQRGFNQHIAWSHTFSNGKRFMLYELELSPENPLQYIYEGELRDIEARTVSAEYVDAKGEVAALERTFYFSHIGPMVDPGGDLGGWPTPFGTVLTAYLPHRDNNRRPEELLRMGEARNIDEFKQAIHSVGLASVHTLAADRYGDAFFGDISVTPNIDNAQEDQCVRGPLASALTEAGYPTLDGSDPFCALGNDPDTAEGILSFDNLAKLDSREYVANANQGFWMANPRVTIDGYPDFMGGRVGVAPNDQLRVRARQLFLQAEERLAGSDDLGEPGFTVDNIREMVFGSRSIQAEHLVDDLVEICQAVEDWSPYTENTASAEEACTVLSTWDKRYLVGSVGAHIFREFHLRRLVNWSTDAPNSPFDLYAIPFDPLDPFNTPAGIPRTDEWTEITRLSLGESVDLLVEAGIPMAIPWGEVQFIEKDGEKFPLAGGPGDIMLNVVSPADYPLGTEGGFIGGSQNEFRGNTYVSAVSWDETDCPDAYSILTYSQSSDPASAHYADGTELYSNGNWIDMPYCQSDIEEKELRRETIQE